MTDQLLVQAGFGSPQRQNRWTVAFRFILAIPQLFWFLLRGIAAFFAVVVGWFAALFMGRLPRPIATFLSNYIVYVTRLYSYLWLMNDTYPPFSSHDEYSVNLDIPVSNVRRLAVLFRIFLLIPAGIVNSLLTSGMEIASVFIWLIVLVNGSMPTPLFEAIAAILRFQARIFAYAGMINGKYPGELFGDAPNPSGDITIATDDHAQSDESAPAPIAIASGESALDQSSATASVTMSAPESTPVEDVPVSEPEEPASVDEEAVSVDEVPASVDEEPAVAPEGASEVPEESEPVHELPVALTAPAPTGAPTQFAVIGSTTVTMEPPRTARLILSRAAKRILVAILIVGALGIVANRVAEAKLLNNESSLVQLEAANSLLASQITKAEAQRSACTDTQSACLHQYFAALESEFAAFHSTLSGLSFSGSTQADAANLQSDTAKLVTLLGQLNASSTGATQSQLNTLQTLANSFDSNYAQVISDLSGSV